MRDANETETGVSRNRTFYRIFRRLRNRYHRWRYHLKHVHPTTYVTPGSHISCDLVAHEYGFIAEGCTIGPKVELGQYVQLACGVSIVGADHRFDLPGVPMIFSGRPQLPPTIIESDVWIGVNAVIMAGVRIGRGSIVAAVPSSRRMFRPMRSGVGFRPENQSTLRLRGTAAHARSDAGGASTRG